MAAAASHTVLMEMLPSQPASIGRVLDAAFDLYRYNLRPLVVLSLMTALGQGLQVIASSALVFGWIEEGLGAGFLVLGSIALTMFLFVFAALASFAVLGAAAEGRRLTILEAAGAAAPRFLSGVGAIIVVALSLIIGMLMLFVPGVYLSVATMLVLVAVQLEGHGPLRAMGRSLSLTFGNWWRTVAVVTVAFYVVTSLQIAVTLLGFLFVGLQSSSLEAAFDESAMKTVELVAQLITIPVYALLYPLFFATQVALYHDLMLRRLGLDLRSQLASLPPVEQRA